MEMTFALKDGKHAKYTNGFTMLFTVHKKTPTFCKGVPMNIMYKVEFCEHVEASFNRQT